MPPKKPSSDCSRSPSSERKASSSIYDNGHKDFHRSVIVSSSSIKRSFRLEEYNDTESHPDDTSSATTSSSFKRLRRGLESISLEQTTSTGRESDQSGYSSPAQLQEQRKRCAEEFTRHASSVETQFTELEARSKEQVSGLRTFIESIEQYKKIEQKWKLDITRNLDYLQDQINEYDQERFNSLETMGNIEQTIFDCQRRKAELEKQLEESRPLTYSISLLDQIKEKTLQQEIQRVHEEAERNQKILNDLKMTHERQENASKLLQEEKSNWEQLRNQSSLNLSIYHQGLEKILCEMRECHTDERLRDQARDTSYQSILEQILCQKTQLPDLMEDVEFPFSSDQLSGERLQLEHIRQAAPPLQGEMQQIVWEKRYHYIRNACEIIQANELTDERQRFLDQDLQAIKPRLLPTLQEMDRNPEAYLPPQASQEDQETFHDLKGFL